MSTHSSVCGLRVAALLAFGLVVGGPLAARDGSDRPPTPSERGAADPVSVILRLSRHSDAPAAGDLVTSLIELGPSALPSTWSILSKRAVPPVSPGEAAQILSEPQRALLLAQLEALPAQAVLDLLDAELERDNGPSSAAAAWYVWGVAGEPEHLERAAALLPKGELPRAERDALRTAIERSTAKLLQRRPKANAFLWNTFRTLDPQFHLAFILGVGAAGDSRSGEFFAMALDGDPECGPALLPQIQRIGRSHDARVFEDLTREVREWLEVDSPTTRSAALRALGEQRDWSSIERMVELLDSPEVSVRSSAVWALERATKLSWREPQAWRTWCRAEVAWRDARIERVLDQLRSNSFRQVVAALQEAAAHPLFGGVTAPWAVDCLQSDNPAVRRAACEALARLDSPIAYPALIDALGDEDRFVAAEAEAALVKLTGKALGADEEAWRGALLQ